MIKSGLDKLDWEELKNTVINCRLCPRLVEWREEVARKRRRAYLDWEYWGKPVPGFGDLQANVLVVGLAPGAHGANRTGRMFTGDSSGDFLYSALHRAGFANQPNAEHLGDGLILKNIYISAVCRCVPPANKPSVSEIRNCLPYLKRDIQLLYRLRAIVVLGRIAYDNILRIYRTEGFKLPRLDFSHGTDYILGEGLPRLVVSYHPSRQNTQTGRLTVSMFDQVWETVRSLL